VTIQTIPLALSAISGYVDTRNDLSKGEKNSVWLSLVPAAWQPGITTVPGGVTATPGTNPDGTGPSPRSTSTGTNPSGDTGDGSLGDNGDAIHPNSKSRGSAGDTASDGCTVAHGSNTSSNYGVIGLAIAGVLVALRRRSKKQEA